jgi:hypothetical protein
MTTIRPTFLTDAAKYFNEEQAQIDSLNWLQSQISDALLEKFAAEYSPVKSEPKEDKYQLRFSMRLANSSDLLTGVLEFVKNGKVYNQITAASSLPGRQYSGSWTRKGGLIPPSSLMGSNGWSVKTTPIYMPDVTGVSGNFYQISPFEIQTSGAVRGDFGVHRDANAPGSLGCVVIETEKGWAAVQREFKLLAGIGVRAIDLNVQYS